MRGGCQYTDRINPLVDTVAFLLSENAVNFFCQLQTELANSALKAVEESVPFTLETDASDVALSTVLHQNGRPVAFGSRSLAPSEKRHRMLV